MGGSSFRAVECCSQVLDREGRKGCCVCIDRKIQMTFPATARTCLLRNAILCSAHHSERRSQIQQHDLETTIKSFATQSDFFSTDGASNCENSKLYLGSCTAAHSPRRCTGRSEVCAPQLSVAALFWFLVVLVAMYSMILSGHFVCLFSIPWCACGCTCSSVCHLALHYLNPEVIVLVHFLDKKCDTEMLSAARVCPAHLASILMSTHILVACFRLRSLSFTACLS